MRRRLLRAAAVLALVAVLGVVTTRTHRVFDLTAHDSLTLSAQTLSVLDRLDRHVRITAFLRRDEPGRVEAVALLDRYEDAQPHVSWRVVDPDDAPGEVARLGIDPVFGGVALRAGAEVERVPTATEQDLTAALARLARQQVATICFTTGHGEPEFAGAAVLLRREGHIVRVVDLLSAPAIPPQCAALVLAGPTQPLGDALLAALTEWTAAAGKLLVLSDPAASVQLDLRRVLRPFGLAIRRGVVFEGDAAGVIGGDVTAPIVRTYSSGHPVVRRLAPTYFPGVQAVAVDESAEARVPGLTVSRLADTSNASYLETAPVEAEFDPSQDTPGPITVVAAADRSRNDGTRIARTRIVVAGDVDFATDRFLGHAGNATLLARAVEWLTLGEDVAAISPNLPVDRPLALTNARVTYLRVVTAGVVPALFALAGAMVWAARRTR